MASLISFSLPKPTIITATSSSLTTPSPSIPTTTSTPEALQEKFGRKGIKFLESNNIPVVELTVRNGSTLRLQIPDAHITSYKPKVYWRDDGFYELLYTVPEDGKESSKVKGGIGLVINDVTDAGTKGSKGSLINTSEWTVKDVDSDAIDAVQVELCCTNGPLYMRYVVSLYPDTIAAAFIMKNNGKKEMTLKSAILSHLRLKKRGKSAIQGLKGCSYCPLPPLSSPFEILSPSEAMKTESPGLFDFGAEPDDKPGSWGAQDVPFTILKRKISRVYGAHPQERLKPVYNTTPSKYEMLDQGHELFFRVIRIGFEDIYIGSPGSLAEKYGKEYFICTGPAAILVPVTLKPGQEWRGAQVIEHDNLS